MTQSIHNGAKVPFSQCGLWDRQYQFYQAQGIEAWSTVPFYATSNPYIAYSYAQVIIHYLREQMAQARYHKNEPFYLVELGAGSGLFSFYLLKSLLSLRASLGLTDMQFIYVMTDFSQSNLDFWQQQPNLQPYLQQGWLDFALYDADKPQSIRLIHKAKRLTSTKLKNSLVVLANYIFDSLRHDFFQTVNQSLQIGMIDAQATITTELNNEAIALTEVDPDYAYQEIKTPCYSHNLFDKVLDQCAQRTAQQFTFPIGALKSMEWLRKLANNNLLLLTTDKGYAKQEDKKFNCPSDIVLHGSAFSVNVNFDALGYYARACKGDSFFQDTQQGITTAALVFGTTFDQLIDTRHAAYNHLSMFGPGHLLNLYSHIYASAQDCSLKAILSYLEITSWDVYVLDLFLPALQEKWHDFSHILQQDVLKGLEKAAANFYYMPAMPATLAQIGSFLQHIKHYDRALDYYHQALNYRDKQEHILYNMALCHYYLGSKDKAMTFFTEVYELNSENTLALGWMDYLKQ
jgi:SAM-dependent MidA family methyltransferase